MRRLRIGCAFAAMGLLGAASCGQNSGDDADNGADKASRPTALTDGSMTDATFAVGDGGGANPNDTSGDGEADDAPSSQEGGPAPCLPSRAPPATPNVLDTIEFGNANSEMTHAFSPDAGTAAPSGVGGLGRTYRAPLGVAGSDHPYGGIGVQMPMASSEQLTFTLRCDSALQNYLTLELWGSDTQQADIQLFGAPSNYAAFVNHSSGGPPPSPERFYYATVPIPIAWTLGHTTVEIELFESNAAPVGQPSVPIYSAFSSTDPYFAATSSLAATDIPTPAGKLTPAATNLAIASSEA